MHWFRRDGEPVARPVADPDPADDPGVLLAEAATFARYVNASAGRLPGDAVVTAREIGDVLREVIGTARSLDIYTAVTVTGLLTDHLPTTLRTFLTVGSAGRAAADALREQLDSLLHEAVSLREAARARDADALATQGNFLRTKFSNSDLDL
ncbi:hypothetical protein [Amycolatopsis sp. H20-H5]|uniref:hypothetical protein n=1 Tax=Amycolatopsis sp. H20-H5 TaxID=3046309 RepID=UPI002DBF20F4|nr:hypothetical protein [Amycolatopsis sp. H20-H5]MEC3982135.1 hypothetical protein [Amycolatopsis sp. H20-H5]